MVTKGNVLQPSYWLSVFQKQLGVTSERAMKYVGHESYPHLGQFARTLQDKKDLMELLKFKRVESTFRKERECQRVLLKLRLNESDKML